MLKGQNIEWRRGLSLSFSVHKTLSTFNQATHIHNFLISIQVSSSFHHPLPLNSPGRLSSFLSFILPAPIAIEYLYLSHYSLLEDITMTSFSPTNDNFFSLPPSLILGVSGSLGALAGSSSPFRFFWTFSLWARNVMSVKIKTLIPATTAAPRFPGVTVRRDQSGCTLEVEERGEER